MYVFYNGLPLGFSDGRAYPYTPDLGLKNAVRFPKSWCLITVDTLPLYTNGYKGTVMELTLAQLKAISTLLDTSDKAAVAAQTDTSINTVKAVLGGRRRTPKIEETLVLFARDKIMELDSIMTEIEANNIQALSVRDYNTKRNATSFSHGRYYARYMDVYLELCHLEVNGKEQAWEMIASAYKDIVPQRVYCVALLIKLLGIGDIEAVTFYNKMAAFN